jgi:hypothetical protein
MPTSTPAIVQVLTAFAVAFTRPTFAHAVTLFSGTLLSSGRRTVASALRAAGLIDERHFTTYRGSAVLPSSTFPGVVVPGRCRSSRSQHHRRR